MRKFLQIFLVIFLTFLALPTLAQRQSINVLNAERKAAEAEIARIDEQLKKIEGTKKDASQQLRLVKERLAKRREVLSSIDAQIAILDDRAREQSGLATTYSHRLDSLTGAYSTIVLKLHSMQLDSRNMEFVLPSSTRASNVTTRHLSAILLTTIAHKQQEIESIQGALGFELRQISSRKEQLAELKADEAKSVEQINEEKRKIERLTASIQSDEQSLTKEKSSRLKAIAALQKQIEDAIRSEVQSSRQKPSSGQKPTINENDPLSKAFVANMGKMLSPVYPSKIVDTYGVHNHPTQKGVKVDNKGVNLSSAGGALVRAVAKGDVRKIFVVPGMGTSILVRHGAYLTVYSNLKSADVSVGNSVDEGSVIGKVADDGILHFELWRETQTLNPANWVKF